MKAKLKGAETGHSLLKRKSEALTKYAIDPYQCTFIAAVH
jgi:V-type H+-transporting ATPase subunit D